MRRHLAIVGTLSLTACAPVSSYFPGAQVVTVEGREHVVRRSGDTYTASMTGWGKATEAEVYVGNLRAIRDVTGCPVAARSVVNEGGRTVAAVACPAGSEAGL